MFAAVKPSGEGVTITLMPVERPSNCAGRPFTVMLVAGVTLYSFAKWVAKMLIVIEVRWIAVMWSLVSGDGIGVPFFDFPAAKVFEGNSNATAKSAAMAGKNFMPVI